MPRQTGISIENSFVQGLVTEATGLNFPENAVTDTYNCIFDEKGVVSRRLGFDFEDSFSTRNVTLTDVVITSFHWKSAAGTGDNSFVVVQIGTSLDIYRIGSGALSDNFHSSISLSTYQVAGAPSPGTVECQFAAGNGYLFVANSSCESFYVEYSPSTNTFTSTAIELEIRDFEGFDDGLATDFRPVMTQATLLSTNPKHHYNLYNQGWYLSDISGAYEIDGKGGNSVQVLDFWDERRSDLPSNSDVWWFYKNGNDAYYPSITKKTPGNTEAPKGHFLLNPYYQDRGTVHGKGITFPITSSGTSRASAIEFFAGRVWYSGIEGQEYSNKIYFSQIIENKRQFGFCYQGADPTSEVNAELVATDGGVISIQEAGRIIKMVTMDTSIMIFATNGIWAITGNQGIGFTANDYSIRKVSNISVLDPASFASLAGYPVWWNSEGIFTASPENNTSGGIQVKPIVDGRIKEFFEDIPVDSRRYARGYYNPLTRTVQWLYRSTAPTTIRQRYEFDRVLVWNILTGAFYPWSINISGVKLNGLVVIEGTSADFSIQNVTTDAGVLVTDAAAAAVTVEVSTTISLSSVFKYLCSFESSGTKFTFSQTINNAYLDWELFDNIGVDFDSFFTTGYKVRGEAIRKFQSSYIQVFSKNNPSPSVFTIQGLWDYANTGDTGRWSSTQRITFSSLDYDYQKRRIKIRGHGVALQFKVQSITNQPFDIIGWSTAESVNARV